MDVNQRAFALILDNTPVGMYLVDRTFKLLRANRVLCDMLGYTEEELLGKPLQSILHPDDASEGMALAKRMRDGDIPSFLLERRYLCKDGTTAWTKFHGSAVRDDDGQVLFGVGVVENIRIHERAQDQRDLLRNDLLRTSKLETPGTLAGGITHDLNNTLSAMTASMGGTGSTTTSSAASASVIECAIVKPVIVTRIRRQVPAIQIRHSTKSK